MVMLFGILLIIIIITKNIGPICLAICINIISRTILAWVICMLELDWDWVVLQALLARAATVIIYYFYFGTEIIKEEPKNERDEDEMTENGDTSFFFLSIYLFTFLKF